MMEYIEDWVERALSCFYKERDKPTVEPNNNDITDILAEFSDEEKLSLAFEKFVAELGLSEEKRQELISCPNEKKLALLVSQNGQLEEDVELLLDSLKQTPPDLASLQRLVIALRTQRESCLASFLDSSGLELLCTSLSHCQNTPGSNSAAFLLLCAFRALLNSESGRQAVLGSDESLEAIARSIGFEDAKSKVAAVEVLSGLCFVHEDGYQRVLTALTQVTEALYERTRFQHLVNDFHKRFSTDRETDRVRTAIIGLFNTLLRNGPAENSVHFRAHLRFELLMLGIETGLSTAKESASSRLEDHIDLFEMMRKEDELTLSGSSEDSGASSPVDFESVVGMAEALHEKLATSLALPHFISLLQHLFMVPSDERHVPLWKLFDLILQQLTLQTTVDGITDVRKPITGIIDMEDVLSRIQTQCDYEMAERELEKVREELEQEKLRNIELENRLADLSDGRSSVSSGISSLSSLPSDPCPSPIPALLPPICAPVAPPPPPPLLGMKTPTQEAQKKVPKPSQPLKTLNWSKFNAEKAKGSVWEHLDDEKMYKQIDLVELEHIFAASSSHKDDDTETIYGTLQKRRETQVSVIDSRRFQNCTIMLSKLKLTHKEIKAALLGMDEQGKLPKDMIEQMLKFVPTKEEIVAINEAVNRHKSPQVLALADRYMYEVAQIPRFEQRLRCLHIIRTYKDRIEALQPGISAIHKASIAMTTCKRLKQYLSLVLATGNYLNYGKRNGNAYGFDLNSLTRLIEVKYSNRADRNLVHYLLTWIDKKSPDITKLKRDLISVFEAARYNQADTQSEIRSLEQAISIVRTELHHMTSQKVTETNDENKTDKKDRFVPVAKQFIISANADYSALDKQFSEMKAKYNECIRMFCVSPQAPPEELFSIMARFLNQLEECHHQQWQENEEAEKVKKQTIARSYFAKKHRRREKEKDFEQLISALQSGDIFREDLSRLRTSFRVTKKTRAANKS